MIISRLGVLCSEVLVTVFKGEWQGGLHMVTTYDGKESFVEGMVLSDEAWKRKKRQEGPQVPRGQRSEAVKLAHTCAEPEPFSVQERESRHGEAGAVWVHP